MTLSCIIIEDEPLAAEKLNNFIAQVPMLEPEGSFDNALEGLQFLKTHTIDLLFLDIQMEKITGIQLLENLSSKPYVVITSAYSDYALKGYELSVFDYLLKPYSFERFLAAVNKVLDDVKLKKGSDNESNGSQIFIKTEYRRENVHLDDILYIEGMQGYLKIYLPGRKILTKQSIKSMLEQLPEDQFIQVHRSYVVALSKIESIERNRIKISDKLIPVGDLYKKRFYERIETRQCFL